MALTPRPLPGLPLLPQHRFRTPALGPEELILDRERYPRIETILEILNLPASRQTGLYRRRRQLMAQLLQPPFPEPAANPEIAEARDLARKLQDCRYPLLAAGAALWHPLWSVSAAADAVSQESERKLILWRLRDPEEHPLRRQIMLSAQAAMLELLTGCAVRVGQIQSPAIPGENRCFWTRLPLDGAPLVEAALRLHYAAQRAAPLPEQKDSLPCSPETTMSSTAPSAPPTPTK